MLGIHEESIGTKEILAVEHPVTSNQIRGKYAPNECQEKARQRGRPLSINGTELPVIEKEDRAFGRRVLQWKQAETNESEG